jgi:hypothetical protein
MKFLHYEWSVLTPQDTLEIGLDAQANVQLLTDDNYYRFKNGQKYQHHEGVAGLAKQSPVFLSPPHTGHWHLVVDLGGYTGSVNVSVRIV